MTRVMNFFVYLLTPRRTVDWVWKLLALSFSSAMLALAVRNAINVPINTGLPQYIAMVMLISAPPYLLGMFTAVKLEILRKELARHALTDILTGLDNRRAFLEKFEPQEDGVFLMMDVDHFKRVNDTYGHAIGDDVLVAIADHLRRSIRKSDLVARIGGEEFAVFLQGADRARTIEIGARISSGVVVDHVVPDRLRVTLSIGAVVLHEGGTTKTELLAMADEALYAAKRAGRSCTVFWPSLRPVSRNTSI